MGHAIADGPLQVHVRIETQAGHVASTGTTRVGLGRVSPDQRFQFDGSYVDRLASGDPQTEEHFTRYFGSLLTMKLRRRLRSPAAVEDAKQETFLRVLTAIRRRGLQTPGALGAFVHSVCNNVLFELYRAGSRTTPLEEGAEQALPDQTAPPETQMSDEEERAHVRRVISTLPDRERELLQWIFFDELDKDEICRRLTVDRDYLRVLLHRAKQRFRVEYARG